MVQISEYVRTMYTVKYSPNHKPPEKISQRPFKKPHLKLLTKSLGTNMSTVASSPSRNLTKCCALCQGQPTTGPLKRCTACSSVFYCCVAHQKTHWKTHKPLCLQLRQQARDERKLKRLENKKELKQPENVFQNIRESCEVLVKQANAVHIDEKELLKFAATLDAGQCQVIEPQILPLRFNDTYAEINFMAVRDLLMYGSFYRDVLIDKLNRGPQDIITFGCLGMHLSHDLDTNYLCNLTLLEVSQLFQIPLEEDYEIQPGIKSVRPHALKHMVQGILPIYI